MRPVLPCHAQETYAIYKEWGTSKHLRANVGCYECHQAKKTDADLFDHEGRVARHKDSKDPVKAKGAQRGWKRPSATCWPGLSRLVYGDPGPRGRGQTEEGPEGVRAAVLTLALAERIRSHFNRQTTRER